MLLSGIVPIWLIVTEKANMWERQQRENESATRLDIIEETYAVLLQEWQGERDAYSKGRWAHRVIRDIKVWTTREHGGLDY